MNTDENKLFIDLRVAGTHLAGDCGISDKRMTI
jgi:hypothetical protein